MVAKRPLSPHLQIYRLPLTAWLSISHRICGVILSLGLVALSLGLLAAAHSPSSYEAIRGFLAGWVGRGVLFFWLLALFLHFCHGIRHLIWDLGLGFERLSLARHSGWELLAAVSLTVLAWVMVIS
jgi:succinate dehydrogenase / fumarate reductase cytochrome b subunit